MCRLRSAGPTLNAPVYLSHEFTDSKCFHERSTHETPDNAESFDDVYCSQYFGDADAVDRWLFHHRVAFVAQQCS